MKLTKEHIVEVRSKIVIVGFNPENADLANPDGAIHKVGYYVTITDENGYRLRHFHNFKTELNAQSLADEVKVWGEINLDYWGEHHPQYGSKAYIDQIPEEILMEKKLDI